MVAGSENLYNVASKLKVFCAIERPMFPSMKDISNQRLALLKVFTEGAIQRCS